MNKIVLASNNSGKLAEFQRLFQPLHIELIPQAQLAIPECPEPYLTFVENALAKARHASKLSQLPAIADDSGICAVALDGQPGIFSARYASSDEQPKSDQANNQKLNQALQSQDNKQIYYVCVLVLVRAFDDPQPIIAEATWHGIWQSEAAGEHGFGYDPHFYLPEYHKTVAQLTNAEKNSISHRAQALDLLVSKMQYLDLIKRDE